MILFKKINKAYLKTLTLLLLCSCNQNLYTPPIIVEKIQKEKYINGGKLNTIYQDLFLFRDNQVKFFLQKHKFDIFLLEEKFGTEFLSSQNPFYLAIITTKDSIYYFHSKKGISYDIVMNNVADNGCLIYTFKNKSIEINRGIDKVFSNNICYKKTKKELFSDFSTNNQNYLSSYKNGKLNLVMEFDSIIFRKNSNVNIDLNSQKFFTPNGYCTEKDNILSCNNVNMKCKRMHDTGFLYHCDTIK